MKTLKIVGIIVAVLLVALIVILVVENYDGFADSEETTAGNNSGDVTTSADETTLGGFVESEEVTMIEIPVED